jgi:hypothetical protein
VTRGGTSSFVSFWSFSRQSSPSPSSRRVSFC